MDSDSQKITLSEADFSKELGELMPALRGYIMSLLPNQTAAEDVAQETHLFLWQKREEFEVGTSFKSWAYKVAYFKTLAAKRDYAREQKRVVFSDETVLRIADKAQEVAEENSGRIPQLRQCLSKLKGPDRKLLQFKYLDKGSLTDLASQEGKSANSIHKTISRLRLRLKNCIDKNL